MICGEISSTVAERRHLTQPGSIFSVRLFGIRVLVIDDEPDSRYLTRALLERAGADVIVAANAGEALDILNGNHPDVILCDIGMPGMDGYAFMRALRASMTSCRIPAAALTAYSGEEDRRRAYASGFDAHLAKPMRLNEVLGTVAKLAGRGSSMPH